MSKLIAAPTTPSYQLSLACYRRAYGRFKEKNALSLHRSEKQAMPFAGISADQRTILDEGELADASAVDRTIENGDAAFELGAVQDAIRQERRRISRDLHDHAGQYLVGIGLRLAALEQTIADPSTNHAFAELRQLLHRFCDELRAISAGERGGVP